MRKFMKSFLVLGIICSLCISIISLEVKAQHMAGKQKSYVEVNTLVENEFNYTTKQYTVLTDVAVFSKQLNNTVEITLTNIGENIIIEWAVVYEASYDIVSIENAELIINNEIKEFKSFDALEPQKSITISLEINGTHNSDKEYRVYGIYNDSSENSSITDYIEYNLVTGETKLNTHDINNTDVNMNSEIEVKKCFETETTILPRQIIGEDTRQLVIGSEVNADPYKRIAVLEITFPDEEVEYATGFMISSRYMLTSAHCLYNSEHGGKAKSVKVTFGVGGSALVEFNATSVSYSASFPSSLSTSDDWGCIRLNSAPGRGYFSIGYASNEVLSSKNLTICGYSPYIDENENIYMLMSYASNTPHVLYSGYFTHLIDTNSGQSGSPAYDNSNIVYGIHSGHGQSYNRACRLTPELVNQFINNGWCS